MLGEFTLSVAKIFWKEFEMYIWNHKKLASDLNKGILSQKQQMLYLLFLLIYMGIIASKTAGTLFHNFDTPLNIYDYIIDVFTFIITILSFFVCYSVNNKGDGKDFISRFICIDFPVTFKMVILAMILSIPATFIDLSIANSNEVLAQSDTVNLAYETQDKIKELDIGTGPTIMVLTVILLGYMFHCYVTAFKIASGQKEYDK